MTQPFYFPDGRLAHNAEDLLELCQQHPDAGTNFLVRQDLEKWLAYIGNYELAECATNARQTELEDRQKLEEFINKSHSLTRSQAVPAAVTQTQNSQVTAPESAEQESAEQNEIASSISPSPEQATVPAVEESKQLAQVESTLNENREESLAPPTPTPEQATEPAVEESKQLAQVESKLQARSEESATPTPDKTASEAEPEEKLSFFQVIARFIVKILYRNKA